MRINLIRRTVHDVHAAAIGLPPRNTRGKMLVGISNAAVMFFLVFVLFGVRSWVAPLPECFDKVIALFVIRKLLECRALFIGNDPNHILVQPLLVTLAEFDGQSLLLRFLLFLCRFPLQGIHFIGGLGLRIRSGGRSAWRIRSSWLVALRPSWDDQTGSES